MVKPHVRNPPAALDDEIFFVDVVDHPESSTSMKTPSDVDDKKCITVDFAKTTQRRGAIVRHIGTNDKKKRCRQDDTVERKRTSVSMLGKTISLQGCKFVTTSSPIHHQAAATGNKYLRKVNV